ncbi:hypothetical protein D3876_16750 [Sphingomonas cavernae]|uniref:Uncharacterized protein n=1 Tax=Sphingomonas cavernae TaxID=2320861 RepID=A0A418W6B2_9SPHN|nr:hypothetical protein D3876_16750 [Sphingomonas cavernae]
MLSTTQTVAQDTTTFNTISDGRDKAVLACPIAEPTSTTPSSPAASPQITAGARLKTTNPFFDFNGKYKDDTGQPIAGFTCQQAGPFDFKGKPWFIQNVRGLQPHGSGPDAEKRRVNALRVCSEDAKRTMASPAKWKIDPATGIPKNTATLPQLIGPFDGPVGGFGCEALWRQAYVLP